MENPEIFDQVVIFFSRTKNIQMIWELKAKAIWKEYMHSTETYTTTVSLHCNIIFTKNL